MDRRRFIVMLGMAPVVVAAAARFEALRAVDNLTNPTGPVTQTVSFTGSHSFKPGDIVTITGLKYSKYPNGTYRCIGNGKFEKQERVG